MDLETFLVHIFRAGGHFVVEAGQLKYRGPQTALTPDLRRAISEHKAQIIADIEWAETLPNEIFIPASVPNDEESIAVCVEGQCLTRKAA
jgi:hypothetical protein